MADPLQTIAGPTPPSYASPQFNIGGQIAALPNALWEGLDQTQKIKLRNAFQNGPPTDAQGNPDFKSMMNTLFGLGDLQQGTEFAKLDLQRQQLAAQQAGRQRFYGPQGPQDGPQANPPLPPSSAPAVRNPDSPNGPQAGPQGDQSRSLVGVVSQHYPQEQVGRMALAIGQRLGVSDPNATLNPEQYAAAMSLSQQSASARNIQPPVPPPTNPSARQPLPAPPPTNTSATGVQPAPAPGPQLPPGPQVSAHAGPQAPPQAGPQAPPPQPPPAPFDERFNAAGPPPTQAPQISGPYLNDLVPPHYRGREGQLITDLHDQATMIGTSPADSKAYLDWADAIQKRVADFTKEYPGIRSGEDPVAYKARLARDTKAGESSAAKQAETWSKLDDEGNLAREHLQLIGRLRTLGADTFSGAWPQVVKMFGDIGIPIDPRLPQVQAMQGVVNQLIPTLRVPNMRVTNFDMSLFKDALPRMINDPKGNALIMDTLTGAARYKVAVGELASRALNGEISPQQFRERIGTLPNPFEQFNQSAFAEAQRRNPTPPPQAAPPGPPSQTTQNLQRFSSPDELSAAIKIGKLKKGDQFISGDGKTRVVP